MRFSLSDLGPSVITHAFRHSRPLHGGRFTEFPNWEAANALSRHPISELKA
jgi:hypothetical protein